MAASGRGVLAAQQRPSVGWHHSTLPASFSRTGAQPLLISVFPFYTCEQGALTLISRESGDLHLSSWQPSSPVQSRLESEAT